MNNQVKFQVLVAGLVLIMSGCIEHRSDRKNTRAAVSSPEEEKYIRDNDFKTFRIYEGRIPCEDCDGIEQRLVIKGDTMGIFRLTETYRNATEDGDATLVCSGQWKTNKVNSKNILVLSQGSLSDSVRRMEYEYHPSEVVQLSLDDNHFKNTAAYRLKMVRKSK